MGHLRDTAGLCRHDTRGHCRGEAEGVAHGEHPFADLQLVAVAHGDDRQFPGIDLDQSEVGSGIRAYDGSVERAVIVKSHFETFGTVDDMIVGDDIAVVADNDARSQSELTLGRLIVAVAPALTGLRLRLLAARCSEEKVEEVVAERVESALIAILHTRSGEALDRDYAVDGRLGGLGEVGVGRSGNSGRTVELVLPGGLLRGSAFGITVHSEETRTGESGSGRQTADRENCGSAAHDGYRGCQSELFKLVLVHNQK